MTRSRNHFVRWKIAGVQYEIGPFDKTEAIRQAKDVEGFQGVSDAIVRFRPEVCACSMADLMLKGCSC